MKVYLDEDVSPVVARILRGQGIDAIGAHEVGKTQLDDKSQLASATKDGRAIATANVVDFLALARGAVATNTEHAGIILIPPSFRGSEFQAIADGIRGVLELYPDGLTGLVIYIGRQRR